MSTDPQRAQSVFLVAVETPSMERGALLDRECNGNEELRHRVEALLKAHDKPDSFLESPPPGIEVPSVSPIAEQPGAVIGPYKLLEQIGEGGFGVVFLAEQERPVRRKVALKVIKPGMDTRQVIARFEAERQALAMMDHPNIAKVLDAGTTGDVGPASRAGLGADDAQDGPARLAGPTGRPYFVMELVQGVPITEYCDQCNLTTRERLALFITVCHAVQHAHQKGVIHRDIKPTNVLVAIQDGQPTPKIIDFGVAKAIGDQALTEWTLTNAFAAMVGTPLYMSPEQAELSPLGVDTRSDIYSLGVLLYEMLTGTTPFDKDRLQEASFDELRRIIREEEPPRPSARLSSLSLGERAAREASRVRASRSGEPSRTSSDSLPLAGRAGEGVIAAETAALATTIATHRRIDPRRLQQSLRGDLDWIVMKCLEKDRTRRYETAAALAADIECFLRDQPVCACPPSRVYRVHKFARRNLAAISTAAVILVALLAGLTIAGWQAWRATQALTDKDKALTDANRERDRAEENFSLARTVVDKMLVRAGDDLANYPELEELRKELLTEALNYYKTFLTQESRDPQVRRDAAIAALRVGDVNSWLGDPEKSKEAYGYAATLFAELAAEHPDASRYLDGQAEAHQKIGRVFQSTGRYRAAESDFRTALKLNERRLAASPGNTEAKLTNASLKERLAASLRRSGRAQEAKPLIESALQELLAIHGSDAETPDYYITRAGVNNGLAAILPRMSSQYRDAMQQAIDDCRRVLQQDPENLRYMNGLSTQLHNLALHYSARGDVEREEPLRREVLELERQLSSERPSSPRAQARLADALKDWAGLQHNRGNYDEAVARFREALALAKKLLERYQDYPEHHRLVARTSIQLGRLLVELERFDESLEVMVPAREIWIGLSHRFPSERTHRVNLIDTDLLLSVAKSMLNDRVSAQRYYDSAIGQMKNGLGDDEDTVILREKAAELLSRDKGQDGIHNPKPTE